MYSSVVFRFRYFRRLCFRSRFRIYIRRLYLELRSRFRIRFPAVVSEFSVSGNMSSRCYVRLRFLMCVSIGCVRFHFRMCVFRFGFCIPMGCVFRCRFRIHSQRLCFDSEYVYIQRLYRLRFDSGCASSGCISILSQEIYHTCPAVVFRFRASAY